MQFQEYIENADPQSFLLMQFKVISLISKLIKSFKQLQNILEISWKIFLTYFQGFQILYDYASLWQGQDKLYFKDPVSLFNYQER